MKDTAKERGILSGCIENNTCAVLLSAEKRMARISELAHFVCREMLAFSGDDVMTAVCSSDEAREIYEGGKRVLSGRASLGEANADEEKIVSDVISACDRFYFCKAISRFDGRKYTEDDALRWLSDGEQTAPPAAGEKKIAFMRSRQANEAFSRFAKYIPGGVMPFGEESFADVCRSVYSGATEYGLIPVENSSDGRLAGLYGTFERYGLYIVMLCDVASPDGEGYTKFALCSRSLGSIKAKGEKILHIRLTLDSPDGLSDLLFCGKYFGAFLRRADLIPVSAAGRENSFDISLCIDNCDLAGLICALKLEYPQFSAVGIYTEIKAEEI